MSDAVPLPLEPLSEAEDITALGERKGPPDNRSVSQVTTFLRCGEAYRLEKVERAPRTPAAWFVQGTAVHGALELWEGTGRQASPLEVHAQYNRLWRTEFDRYKEIEPDESKWMTGGRVKPETDIANRQRRGHEQLDAYMGRVVTEPWQTWEYLPDEYAVELPFEIDLDGVIVKGAIDTVIEFPDGSLRVRDWKTGSKIPESNFQLGVYDLALGELFGERPGWGDYYMLKSAPTPPADLSRWTRERITRYMHNVDKAIRLGLFTPNPGDACRTCGVAKFCDLLGSDLTYAVKEESGAA